MNIRKNIALLALAATAAVAPALAIPQYYQIAGGSVAAYTDGSNGLSISHSLSAGLSSQSFTLDDNDSFTFDFFNIWTTEASVNWGEDTNPQPISATLNFAVPAEGATVSGTTVGGYFLFVFQAGTLTWDGPTTITTGDRVFEVSLSNESFNSGFLGLGTTGATVKATVRQVSSSVNNVPDSGSTVALLGAGLLGLAALRRKFARR